MVFLERAMQLGFHLDGQAPDGSLLRSGMIADGDGTEEAEVVEGGCRAVAGEQVVSQRKIIAAAPRLMMGTRGE